MMTMNPADVMALALWIGLIVAYLRRLLGPLFGCSELPGLYGPLLAVLVGEAVVLGSWWLGLRDGDWRDAVVTGIHAAIVAMGGYSGLKALLGNGASGANGGNRGNEGNRGSEGNA